MVGTGIFRILRGRALLSEEHYLELLKNHPDDPVSAITALGYDKEIVIDMLVMATKIQYIMPDSVIPSLGANKIIPEKTARNRMFVPLSSDDSTVFIALSDPTNSAAIADAEFTTGKKARAVFTDKERVEQLLTELYNPLLALSNIRDSVFSGDEDIGISQSVSPDEVSSVTAEISEKPIVRIVNAVFSDAISQGASDIHFEPTETNLEVRYRIDGDLSVIMKLPFTLAPPIVSRIKILSRLDISVSRVPQDGKLRVRHGADVLEMRVSTLPTAHGEKCVVRILNPAMTRVGLHALGFPTDVEESVKTASKRTQGMLIVTGPTGSGKTTTLYSLLSWLK
jgi:type IV pilus assembly protein PilB